MGLIWNEEDYVPPSSDLEVAMGEQLLYKDQDFYTEVDLIPYLTGDKYVSVYNTRPPQTEREDSCWERTVIDKESGVVQHTGGIWPVSLAIRGSNESVALKVLANIFEALVDGFDLSAGYPFRHTLVGTLYNPVKIPLYDGSFMYVLPVYPSSIYRDGSHNVAKSINEAFGAPVAITEGQAARLHVYQLLEQEVELLVPTYETEGGIRIKNPLMKFRLGRLVLDRNTSLASSSKLQHLL